MSSSIKTCELNKYVIKLELSKLIVFEQGGKKGVNKTYFY